MSRSDLSRFAARGLVVTATMGGAQAVLQVGVVAVLARMVSPADFGIVGAALVFVSLGAVFSELGVGVAVVQKPTLQALDTSTANAVSVLLGILIAIAIFVGSSALAGLIGIESADAALRYLSASFVFAGFTVVPEAMLRRRLEFSRLAKVRLTSYSVGYVGAGVPAAVLLQDYRALIVAYLVQSVAKWALISFFREDTYGFRLSRQSARELVAFGMGHTLGYLGSYAALNSDTAIAARLLGSAAVGYYGRAFQLLAAPLALIESTMETVLFPAMSAMQHDRAAVHSAFRSLVELAALFTVPGSIAIAIAARPLVITLFGEDWMPASSLLAILILTLFPRLLVKLSRIATRAVGSVYPAAGRQLFYAFNVVMLGGFGASVLGLDGLALGVLLASCLAAAMMVRLASSVLDGPAHIIRAIVAAAPSSLAVILAGSLPAIAPPSGRSSILQLAFVLTMAFATLLAANLLALRFWVTPEATRLFTMILQRIPGCQWLGAWLQRPHAVDN